MPGAAEKPAPCRPIRRGGLTSTLPASASGTFRVDSTAAACYMERMKLLALAIVAAVPCLALADINKCTAADGGVMYTDTPCPSTYVAAPMPIQPNARTNIVAAVSWPPAFAPRSYVIVRDLDAPYWRWHPNPWRAGTWGHRGPLRDRSGLHIGK